MEDEEKYEDEFSSNNEIGVEESSNNLGGWIWIILFGIVMTCGLVANMALSAAILNHRKKRKNIVYLLFLLIFLFNLCDYGLIIFEFSLGIQHLYPYGLLSCKIYQVLLKSVPVLQASAMPILLFSCISTDPTRKYSAGKLMCFILCGLFTMEFILSIPTAYFASIVNISDKNYCEMDLRIVGSSEYDSQISTSIYYLFYLALFSYWLQLIISVVPMVKLFFKANVNDKHPELCLVMATVSSFFVFYLLHAVIVLTRHCLDIFGIHLTTHQSWLIKVAQSLSWLIAYFWHFTRPCLIFVLDSDLKFQLFRWIRLSDYGMISNLDSSSANMRDRTIETSPPTTTLPKYSIQTEQIPTIIMTISDEMRPIHNNNNNPQQQQC